jgi:glutaconate CoA-transferase subunit B
MSQYATDYTAEELMAVVISRHVRNDDIVLTGMATGDRTGTLAVGIPVAAMGLAKATHAPDATLLYGGYIVNPDVENCPTVFETGGGLSHWKAQARLTDWYFFSIGQRGEITLGFSSVAQVDKFGNVNIVAIGDYEKPKVRLVGNIFETEHYTLHRREILVMDHDRRRFVERVDYVTGPGYLDGPGARERAGLEWGGPCLCVTDLAVMDYDETTKRMRLASVHPGVTVDQVMANTGFELIVSATVPQTEPPTVEQVGLLRNRIDRHRSLLTPKAPKAAK